MTDLDVATGQVTAALKNADGTQNIYLTTDPTVNALTVTISNGLDHDIVFPAGTPACDEGLPSGQSAIYFYFGGLLDNADIAAIPLTAPGWRKGTFTGSDSLQYLVIAPEKEVKLPSGRSLTFELGHVLAHGAPSSGNGGIWLAGATGVSSMQSQVQLYLNVANPPQPGKQTLDVDVAIGFDDPPEVYTGKSQSLTLHLINKLQTPLVPGGTPSWNGVTPQFRLTLVYGDGPGALTSAADAANIVVDVGDEYGNLWKRPECDGQGTSPYWILRPDPNGGGTVLGTAEHAAIEFAITGIEATLPDGMDEAISVAYLSWRDVPGYNDGSTALPIMKKASPQVLAFSTIPSQLDYQQEVTLDWLAVGCDGVYLVTGQDQNHRRDLGGRVPDPDKPAKLTPVYGTTYQLYAYKNPIPAVSPPFPLEVTFNKMVIKKFEADPAGVTSHQSTTLSWDVQHAKKVSYQGRGVDATSSSVETPASDTTYNLTATWVDDSQVQAAPVHVTVVPVQPDGYPSWTGDFTGSGRAQLLCCSSGQNLGLGTVTTTSTGTSIGWAPAGAAPPGVSPQSAVTWLGDFTRAGRAQIMSYSPGDRTWRLGTFTGTTLSWTQIDWRAAGDVLIQNGRTWVGDFYTPSAQVLAYSPGNGQFWCGGFVGGAVNDMLLWDDPALFLTGYAQSDPTWAADFTGCGGSQILFCSPGNQNWWLGTVWLPIPPTISWTQLGGSPTAFRYDPGDPTWVADFTRAGKSQVLFCSLGDQSWWLGSFTGGEHFWSKAPALGWAKVSDTHGFGYDPGNHPTWVADFTGGGQSQVLFCFTGDQHWWLGTYNSTNLDLDWAEVSDTSKTTFRYGLGDPTWVADFTGVGKSQILFYSRSDQNWYLGTYTGTSLSWTQVA